MACPFDWRGMHDMPTETKPIIRSPKARRDVSQSVVVPLYAKSEGAIFNFLAADFAGGVAPYPYVDVTNGDGAIIGERSVRVAAWTCLYLYGVLNEDRRPKEWTDDAGARLRVLADWLLTQQAGSPTESQTLLSLIGPTLSSQLEYGGFLTAEATPTTLLATVYSEDVGTGGLALLRAYQMLGDAVYQEGYRRAATCLRRMQSGGKLTTKYAALTAAGGRYDSGMWSHKLEVRDPTGLGGGSAGTITGMVLRLVVSTPNFSTAPPERSVGFCQWPIDFDALPAGATIIFRFTGHYENAGGAAVVTTFRLRYGPIATQEESSIDGAVIMAVEANGASGDFYEAASIARPTGLQWLSLSGETTDFGTHIKAGLIGIEVVSSATDNAIFVVETDDFNGTNDGAEVLHHEHTIDFDTLTGATVTMTYVAALTYQGASPFGGTMRLRLGGTRDAADGTEIMAFTSTDFFVPDANLGIYSDFDGVPIIRRTFTMARPSGVQNIKFTNEGDADSSMKLRQATLLIRGS